MKKMIVLFLCIAVLTCSVAAMPAMDVEAATKFGTLSSIIILKMVRICFLIRCPQIMNM